MGAIRLEGGGGVKKLKSLFLNSITEFFKIEVKKIYNYITIQADIAVDYMDFL